jgi:hypothetical protein
MIAFSFDISIFARLGSKICAIGIILVLEDTASSTSTISLSTSTIKVKTAQLQKPLPQGANHMLAQGSHCRADR